MNIQQYNKNFNEKISSIFYIIKEKHPEIKESELIETLNSNIKSDILNKYSIDIKTDTFIQNNETSYKKFLFINFAFYSLTIILLIYMFLKFNNKKDKEISEITKYLEEINKKNYKLDIDGLSEDELSILKNEIYKTTIMLKETADISKKEKLELKDSLSDISHQLKTPLTSILISLDNIIDNPDMDNQTREEFIRKIKQEITNITFLVKSILKLSKLETNTVDFNVEETSTNSIINEVKRNLSTLCDLKNIELIINSNEDSKLKCDFKWQVEAISNIVKNSIEHSPINSQIIITINNNKVYAEITIKDFGNGIDKNDLPHIFERFYKCKNSQNDSIGIGLSLAKKIIEKDNGNISVSSNNSGTMFTIKYYK